MTEALETEEPNLWRRRLWALVVWLGLGLALHLLQSPLYWHIFFLGPVFILLHFVWGAGQAAYNLYLGSVAAFEVGLLSLANLVALLSFSLAPLWHWGDRLLFSVAHEAQFDTAVKSVEAGGPLTGVAGTFAYAASEDRQFVVFFWLEGIPDGGTAIIYDPANRLTQQEVLSGTLEQQIQNLVLESPIECWDFTGPYSKCHYD